MVISLKKLTRTSDRFLRKELSNVPNFEKQAEKITCCVRNPKFSNKKLTNKKHRCKDD